MLRLSNFEIKENRQNEAKCSHLLESRCRFFRWMQDLQASRCFNTYRILGDTDVLYGSDPLATEGDTPNLTARYLAPFRAHNHFSECGHGLSKVGPIIASLPLTPATILKLIMVCQTEGA